MFKLTTELPPKFWVALSGGIDSAAVLHWLNKPSKKNRLLGAVYINHGTPYGERVEKMIDEHYSNHLGVNVIKFRIDGHPPNGESKEKWWRDRRYECFNRVPGNDPIILAHHMDDCLEEMVMSSFVRGYRSTIPYRNGRCIRPFRLWKKEDIVKYAQKHDSIVFEDDPSNRNTSYKRNFIRHEIVPSIKKLNPGVYKIVARLIEDVDDN